MRSPAFAFFHRDAIKTLQENNKHRIKLLNDGMKELTDKYAKKDENGNPFIENGNFVFNDDAARHEFLKCWQEFGATEIEINM